MDPSGFDCSGLVVYILNEAGIHIPTEIRHCNEFFDSFGVFIHREYILPGDLVFVSDNGISPTHMGIVYDAQHYINAPGRTDAKICIEKIPSSLLPSSPNQIYHKNPIGFKRISFKSGRWQKLLT